ncbi:MAG TPA: hypothetical protein VHG28_19595 [Longimicrobiaceae bacterium]|nr:hypothetical protein [Longimicrobiaceae bacterium]
MPRSSALLIILSMLAVPVRSAHSQAITCVQPAEPNKPGDPCTVTLRSATAREVLVVQVRGRQGPIRGTTVTFESEGGNEAFTASAATDAEGNAQTTWSGSIAKDPVVITAEATVDGRLVHRRITLKAPPEATSLLLEPRHWATGDRQAWYEKRQLPAPVAVRIAGVSGGTQCQQARVVFRPIGGGASPDSVYGMWRPNPLGDTVCTAEARWRLAEGVGYQHLQATLVGEPSKQVTFTAVSRALPRLLTALAWSNSSGYSRLDTTETRFRVTRTVRPDSVVAVDSVVITRTTELEPRGTLAPVVGVEFPIWPALTPVRLSVAASITEPTRDWFAGISILQLVGMGLAREALGIDLHGVVQVSRRRVLVDPSECRAQGTEAACEQDTRTRPVGVGLMLAVDGITVLGNLLAIFGS